MAENIPKVTVIGAAYIDMAIRCPQMPTPGQYVTGSTLSYTPSGPGTIQAIQAAFCGCEVHLISKVGNCPFGEMLKKSLDEHKINTDFVFTAKAKHSGTTVTIVDSAGKNSGCVYMGANNALTTEDIESAEQIIAEADVCLIHGRMPEDAIAAAIRYAKLHSTKLILNPARPNGKATGEESDFPQDYFSADILIPNLYEAADITDQATAGIHTAKLIGSDLVARGANAAVITMGKRGCMVVDREGPDHIPAFNVELVDKTGRGDAFAGALAAYAAVKDNLREGVKFASAAGALSCTKFGSIEALPRKAEIIQLLQEQDIQY